MGAPALEVLLLFVSGTHFLASLRLLVPNSGQGQEASSFPEVATREGKSDNSHAHATFQPPFPEPMGSSREQEKEGTRSACKHVVAVLVLFDK